MRSVADAMTPPVVVEPSATIQEASAAMLDGSTEAAIVVDERKVRGLLTARHVARALADGRDPGQTPVSAIVERDPPLVRDDAALAEVRLRMRAEHRALAVVVGRDGEPLGFLADPEAAP